MRRTIRSAGITLVALVGALSLAIASAFTAALAYGAIALIVPGTGTPDANKVEGYLQQARDRYLTTTACGAKGGANCQGADLQGINYPATFFPLAFIPGWCTASRCNTWDDSVGQGTANLNTAIDAALANEDNADGKVIVFGYSQGGAVVADSLAGHIAGLSAEDRARIQVVTIGGIENPDGGLWQRLSFLKYIPGLDISFNPRMTSPPGVNYTSYGFQYDPVVNAPRYFGNALAVLNALAAFENVHGYYLAPNANGPDESLPYGYTDTTLASAINCANGNPNCRTVGGNTFVTIPALTLPIYNLVLGLTPGALKPLVQPLVNLLTPVTRLLIDIGYDTSGNPNVSTPLSILPFNPATFNPVDFSVKFVAAIAQGIRDAINGGPASTTTLLPATNSTTPVSTLAPRSITPTLDAVDAANTAVPTEKLATVTDLAATTAGTGKAEEASVSAAVTSAVAAATPAKTTTPATDTAVAAVPTKTADPVSATDDAKTVDVPQSEATKDDTKQTDDVTKGDDVKGDVTKADAADTGSVTNTQTEKPEPKKEAPKKAGAKKAAPKKAAAKDESKKADADAAGDAGKKDAA